jgi:fatty acid desaturase
MHQLTGFAQWLIRKNTTAGMKIPRAAHKQLYELMKNEPVSFVFAWLLFTLVVPTITLAFVVWAFDNNILVNQIVVSTIFVVVIFYPMWLYLYIQYEKYQHEQERLMNTLRD